MSLQSTAAQTVGPFFHIGLTPLSRNNLAAPGVAGEHITIQGRVLDGDGKPVPDAMLEIWQANSHGKLSHPEDTRDLPAEPAFKGFGRIPTDDAGAFSVTTIKPGRVPGPGGNLQAPHIVVFVFSRGLLKPLLTRIYFQDEPSNETDVILNLVPVDRRSTLIPKQVQGAKNLLEWNVVLQGERETVFFDW